MHALIAKCREHDVDPRTYLRDVLLRVGKVGEVREPTRRGWKHRRSEGSGRARRPRPLAHRRTTSRVYDISAALNSSGSFACFIQVSKEKWSLSVKFRTSRHLQLTVGFSGSSISQVMVTTPLSSALPR